MVSETAGLKTSDRHFTPQVVLDKVAEQWSAIDLDPCHDRNPCHDRDSACLVWAELVYDIREGQDGLFAIDSSATSSASCARGPQSGSSSDY